MESVASQEPATKEEEEEEKETKGNPHHTKSLLDAQHKLLTYVLTKLSMSEI